MKKNKFSLNSPIQSNQYNKKMTKKSEPVTMDENSSLSPKNEQKKHPMRKMLYAYLLWAFLGIFGAHRFYLGFFQFKI
jgi:hypothetical protein